MNARLALLGTVAPGVAESEVFRLALQHAVGELGALGGMIHLRGPMSALRLVSTAGLPPALTRTWEIIDQEGPLAPSHALHEGNGVWVPLSPAWGRNGEWVPVSPEEGDGERVPLSPEEGDEALGAVGIAGGADGFAGGADGFAAPGAGPRPAAWVPYSSSAASSATSSATPRAPCAYGSSTAPSSSARCSTAA